MLLLQDDLVQDGMISVEDKMKLMDEHGLERRSMAERFSNRRNLQMSVMKDRMRKRKEQGMRTLKDRQQQERDNV